MVRAVGDGASQGFSRNSGLVYALPAASRWRLLCMMLHTFMQGDCLVLAVVVVVDSGGS